MSRRVHLRSAALAVLILAAAGPAFATGNTIKLDITGTGAVSTLTINQDATNNSNTITTTGAAGGAQIPIRGKWASISIAQHGAGNVLEGSGITGTAGSSTASLSLTYGSGSGGGNNVHSLTIGGTTAPANASVTVSVINTDAANGQNAVTDVLDGSSLTYALDVDGTANTVSNTVQATGANNLSLTLHGGSAGAGNTVTNTVTGATSSNITVAAYSDNNSITNLSNGSGDKTFSVLLPTGGTNGNTVVNDFTGGTGTQSSSLLVTDTLSKVNFNLAANGAGTTSAVTLTDVVGAAGAAAKLALSQSGANDSIALTVNGNGFAMGSSLGVNTDTGVLISQASNNAVVNTTVNAAAAGYVVSISQ